MAKRAVFLLLGLLTAATVLGVSCSSPAATTTQTTSAPVTTTAPPKTTTPATTAPSGKPLYGGTLTMISQTNYSIFGPAVSNRPGGLPGIWEQFTYSDRKRQVAGGGTASYADGPTSMEDVIGCLASKWSTKDQFTWVLDIRQGVYFQKNPGNPGADLVNGRQMTADDAIASIEFIRDTPSSWASVAEPRLHKAMTVEKTGPWQITVHTPEVPVTTYTWIMGGGGSMFVWPKEWLAKYGTSNDWKVQVGTGPYMPTDWVDNSVLSMKRNANYWEKNPVGPGTGDQLPYLDGLKVLVIPDISTQLAALRTGKADVYVPSFGAVALEDWNSLKKTNPQMKDYRMLSYPLQVGFRRDKTELPFKDLRVRRALMMATDMLSLKNGLYGGEAELLDSPARILYPTIYTPLDQLPAETQELYAYNPDKAKALLKEAGYPNGFKTTMTIDSSSTASDMAQTFKAMWIKVGVDVDIQIKENAVYQQLWATRTYPETIMTMNAGGNGALFVRYSFGYFRGPNSYNPSYADEPTGSDPTIEKAYEDLVKVVNVDFPAADKVIKEINKYILSQAFLVPAPAPYVHRVWQPWLKDFYGEGPAKLWLQYVWLDRAMKEQMTGIKQ